jgi:small ligand-binding sensory domain FIST
VSAFLVGHATHPDWRGALALAAAQVDSQRASRADAVPPSLGLVYFTDHYAAHAQPLLDELRQRWPGVSWVGSAGVGVAAGAAEYIDEPALVLMLAALPPQDFEVFSGAHKLQRIAPFSALVHADPSEADLNELITELSDRLPVRGPGGFARGSGAPGQRRVARWPVRRGLLGCRAAHFAGHARLPAAGGDATRHGLRAPCGAGT